MDTNTGPDVGADRRPWSAEAAGAEAPVDDAKPPRWGWGKRLLLALVACIALGVVAEGVKWWLAGRGVESTDDAYIDAHVSQVSPQIAGRVAKVLVDDNQEVTSGQTLLEIDPRDQQEKLNEALAQRGNAAAQVEQAKAQVLVQQASLEQATANVRVAEADLFQAQADLARYRAIDPRAVTKQQTDNAQAAARSAQAKLDASKQAVAAGRAQVEAARSRIEAAQASLRQADVNVANAKLQLSYATVTAPQDGRVTKRTVAIGNYVTPGQPLLAIVPDDVWITANFKETQLTHMRPGQHVELTIDAYPDARCQAHIDSFQTGTGAVFSSLPPENATGNWVKVVQRVPVKIVFDDDCARAHRLSPGMSVEPRVRVR